MLIFCLQLPKDKCAESFEKSILRLLNPGGRSESRELEKNLRYHARPTAHRVNVSVS